MKLHRTKLWCWFLFGAGAYLAVKIGFGWQEAAPAISAYIDSAYWSGAILLLHYVTTPRGVES